jgi:predicted O-methyltransferase YrrM
MQKVSKAELGVTGCTTRKYMQPGEQEVLIALVKSVEPHTMVEIGCNEGITALAVLENVPSIERYIGIDVSADYQFEIPAQQSERPDVPGVLVNGDPRFYLRMRGGEMPHAADVVFIDGDHGRHAVMLDSIWAATIINHGGLIVWHDYGNPTVEVTGVLNRLQAHGRELCHVVGTWLVFERR